MDNTIDHRRGDARTSSHCGWVELSYRAPLELDGLIGFFGRRAVPGVEQVLDGVYRRSVRLAHGGGVIELRAGADSTVVAELTLDDERDRRQACAACRRLFDLDADP